MQTYCKTKRMTYVALFTALIAAGAFIKIPVPVVPFTLQFLFTTLAGMLLGPKLGALSVALYITIGLLGFPIFAQGGGIGYLFQPTFGYLIGFSLGAFLTGKLIHQKNNPSTKSLVFANIMGLIAVYLVGMVYYYLISHLYIGDNIGLWPLFLYCFLLAVPGDLLLCFLAALIGKRILPFIQKQAL